MKIDLGLILYLLMQNLPSYQLPEEAIYIVHCPVYLYTVITNTAKTDDIAILPRCYVPLSSPGRKYLFLLKIVGIDGMDPQI